MTDTTPQPAIAAAVIVHEGRLLLVRRRIKDGSLSWQFPAGELEPGEDPEDAAVRETREETGLVVKATKVLGERVHPATGRTMIYVACYVLSGKATVADEDELDDIAWTNRDSLNNYIPHPLFQRINDHLAKKLE